MAATDAAGRWGPVIAAALAVPGTAAAQGLAAPITQAAQPDTSTPDTRPGEGLIGLRWLSYRDWQPGLDRITVSAPALLLRLPVGARWAIETVAALDSVSGASPRYHSAISGASRMEDRRRAGDVRVTHYGRRATWSLAAANSRERDFISRAVSARTAWSSEDNNRTWSVEAGHRSDRIGSANDPTLMATRRTIEAALSVTQAWSRQDVVQASLTHAAGHGYLSDPYKLPDARPSSRHQSALALRWNHHFDEPDVVLRTSLRLYRDSFGIRSQTLALEPVFGVGDKLRITPSVRLYSQDAASFYYNPRFAYTGVPYPEGDAPAFISADQRLAAFGALTLGVRLALELGQGWEADVKIERYQQRTAWHLGSEGSRGLAPFSARVLQFGLARRF